MMNVRMKRKKRDLFGAVKVSPLAQNSRAQSYLRAQNAPMRNCVILMRFFTGSWLSQTGKRDAGSKARKVV